jgi:hypothetical protein
MKLFKLKNFAMIGAMSIAGTGLIGVGAHAVFTTSTASSQTITAGTPQVVMSSPSAVILNCQTVANAITHPGDCQNITLTPPAPVNSTFDTAWSVITITNIGNIAVSERSMQLSDVTDSTSAGYYLQQEMNVCISAQPSDTWVVANGPLHVGTALSPSVNLNGPWNTPPGTATVLAANGGQDAYSVNFYAGQDSTLCGPNNSAGPHTASQWGSYVTPASLGNEAEGGNVAVTLSMNYVS